MGLSLFRHLHGVEITAALLEEAGDFLLSQTADVHFVVELGDGKDLLLLVEFPGCCPPDELFALMGIGPVEGIDQHVGLLVGCDVAPYGLAENFWIAVDVEIVVLQLESQPHLLAEFVEVDSVFLGCVGK